MGEAGVRKSDLRGSIRFPIEGAVAHVYINGIWSKLGIARTNRARGAINLSKGGILVRTTEKLKAGTPVRVRLEIEMFKDVIEADGEVRWCYQHAHEEGEFYAGIQFRNLPAALTDKITKLCGFFTSTEYKTRTAARKKGAATAKRKSDELEWRD